MELNTKIRLKSDFREKFILADNNFLDHSLSVAQDSTLQQTIGFAIHQWIKSKLLN